MHRPHHTPQPPGKPSGTEVVPAVLPQVIATVDQSGTVRLTVDGIEHPDGPTPRGEMGTALATIADSHGGPVRVEVREPDGSRYADILQPHHPTPDGSPPGGGEPGDDPVLRGEGFLPGETVLVAVVTTTIAADQNGAATLTDSPSLPHQLGDVVLFGSASGTIVRGSLPARPVRRWRRR